jgi:aldehyde dehydrogenase (NAD+)
MQTVSQLQALRDYFNSGATKSYQFRKQKLEAFRRTIIQHENEIMDALYLDLKKAWKKPG